MKIQAHSNTRKFNEFKVIPEPSLSPTGTSIGVFIPTKNKQIIRDSHIFYKTSKISFKDILTN